jgi:hypothetical protein
MEHLTQAVFDYMTLIMIDYNASFSCHSVEQISYASRCTGYVRGHGYQVIREKLH